MSRTYLLQCGHAPFLSWPNTRWKLFHACETGAGISRLRARGRQAALDHGIRERARLSQFTADELAETGFDILWIALIGTGSGYDKLKGQELTVFYQGLKSRGVAILSSMIIGFPFQDRAP